jgi:hypothetical protein
VREDRRLRIMSSKSNGSIEGVATLSSPAFCLQPIPFPCQ